MRKEAGKYERLCYERQAKDLKDGAERGLRYVPAHGEKVVRFIEKLCKHHKGEWAGQPLLLEAWQKDVIQWAFSWLRADGTRRFRTMYCEVPRKNGKSELAGALGLYLMLADGEAGAEVYSSATKKDQAKIVWGTAEAMVRASPPLKKHVRVLRSNLSFRKLGGKFEPLGADSTTLDGLNPHGNIIDELHAHRDRKVWDVLDTAMGARRQPMTVVITTAGTYDKESIGWQQHDYACKVLEGVVQDDSFFAFIAAADEGDDNFSPTTQAKANPNYGISVKPEYLAQQAEKAKHQTSFLNEYLRLHLNIWAQQVTRWLPLDAWNAADNPPPKVNLRERAAKREEELVERRCWGGLDLSSKMDLTALALVFPNDEDETLDVVCRFWLPEARMHFYNRQGQRHYATWAREGWLSLTPGNVVDYEFIRKEIVQLADKYTLVELAYDPWGATDLATRLTSDGVHMLECRQGYKTLSEPSKDLEAHVAEKQLRHWSNPVLRYCAANAVITRDAAGNIKPDKEKATAKIDGVVAVIMALSRVIQTDAHGKSYLERSDMVTLG